MPASRTRARSDQRYRITVVCLGNICRSPMGETVLRDRIETAGLSDRVVVDSAGTGTWNLGNPADARARAALDQHGYGSATAHRARQITPTWFAEIDLVLAMDQSNYADLERLIARSGIDPELRMMRSFDAGLTHLPEPGPGLDVPDPYYGGAGGFAEVLRMIEDAADGVVRHVGSRLGA